MKNILIITQKVDKNDPILGFFHSWILEFAQKIDSVTVICLEEGQYDLPSNVKVLSLGKEKGRSKLKYIFNFYKYIWQERKDYDTVFVHMNPIYIILGGLWWKLRQKKIFLWYTHKADQIFTASNESLRLVTNKKMVTGHGIDIALFKPHPEVSKENIFLTVGRISEVKNNIKMLSLLKLAPNFKLQIIGLPITESDKIYYQLLIQKIKEEELTSRVEFIDHCPQGKLLSFYQRAKVFINFSDTGSLDKAVLEALAMNVPVLTTNEAFATGYPVFRDLNSALTSTLNTRDFIENNHSLPVLINRLVTVMS